MSTGFSTHTGKAVPLDQANVDTDQIIPKQFLTSVSRKGFGKNLFFDWRYLNADASRPDPDFILNYPQHQGASVLLTRENFGCGSSREHAPWALGDYGFKVIVATSFADIFYGNCINNQILPIQLSSEHIDALFDAVKRDHETEFKVDLHAQCLVVNGVDYSFQISAPHKFTLTSGLDSIGQTLLHDEAITQFESKQLSWQ
ncbi:3-isopropylmalate dehydratase small subunit [Alteromonas sediminis]|uniref:3-isopropylmalate dehydratase small subunit n=1 Tax=Alteromonas sediminis TaxID=2259342 RepID=A0A3N5Y4X7_9ALTE|nr:3-isopropylmalate dehydratase small subunit [Alteromonas sediminis]RPJ68263.1 3-isopropylmalate dehydratase small subunit [Alteromonas sediminis]